MNINKYDDNETFISGMEDTLPITLDSIPEESVLEDNIVVESDNMPIVKESQDISSYTSAPMQFDDGLENSEPQLQADNVSSHNIKSEEFNKKLMSDLDSDVSSESDKEGSDDEGVDIPYTPKAIMKSAIKYIAVEVYERYGREHVRNFMRDQLGLDPDKEYKWEYNAGGTYERKTQTAWEWDSESGTWKVKESVTKTKINGEKTVERYSAADADKNDAVMESVATGNTIGSDNTIDNDVEVKNVDNAVKESVAADSTSPEMFVNKVPAGSKECWKPECNQS